MVRELTAAGIALAATTGLLRVTSPDIVGGQPIPKAFMATRCGGENRAPTLVWTGAPSNAASFAIVMHDADAPIPGGFYHWVVYNLPAGTNRLDPSTKLNADQLGETSTGQAEYHGPCPPPGPAHHYVTTVYALDIPRISSPAALTGPQLEQRIAGHVVARGVLEATAARQ
jgi:Raf kinase inhibitor-like YbhB/YbcL family protein